MRARDVSVVIPSWNSEAYLGPCLRSVLAGVAGPESVMVVDNGSSDGSLALLEGLGVPHITLPVNRGFAAAVNLGIAATRGRFVFVLNVDTVVADGCIATLAATLDGDDAYGGVQPRLVQAGSAPARVYSDGQRLGRDGRASEIGAGAPLTVPAPGLRETFGVCGAACLLRREMLADVGDYDERYFAFYEDVELNARARLLGWRFGCVETAEVTHVGNAVWQQSAPRPAQFNTRLVARNRLATDIKLLPVRSLPRVLVAEAGALALSVHRRSLRAAIGGRLAALRWLPALLAERRSLRRRGDPRSLCAWLS